MYCGIGYITKKCIVFKTLVPLMSGDKSVADSGDIIYIKGNIAKNYTRLAKGDNSYSFPVAGVVFKTPVLCAA